MHRKFNMMAMMLVACKLQTTWANLSSFTDSQYISNTSQTLQLQNMLMAISPTSSPIITVTRFHPVQDEDKGSPSKVLIYNPDPKADKDFQLFMAFPGMNFRFLLNQTECIFKAGSAPVKSCQGHYFFCWYWGPCSQLWPNPSDLSCRGSLGI